MWLKPTSECYVSSFGQIIPSNIDCLCWRVIAETREVSRNCHDSWRERSPCTIPRPPIPPSPALCPTGICVRFNRTPISMHHKFAVVDGRKLITGSLNWTCTGVHDSNENVIVTEVTELVRPYVRQFTGLWLRNDPEQPRVWRRTPPRSTSALRILRYSDVAVKVTDQRRRVEGGATLFWLKWFCGCGSVSRDWAALVCRYQLVLESAAWVQTQACWCCSPLCFFLCVWFHSLTT